MNPEFATILASTSHHAQLGAASSQRSLRFARLSLLYWTGIAVVAAVTIYTDPWFGGGYLAMASVAIALNARWHYRAAQQRRLFTQIKQQADAVADAPNLTQLECLLDQLDATIVALRRL